MALASTQALGALNGGYLVLLHATAFALGTLALLPLVSRHGPAARARLHATTLAGMLAVTVLCWLPIGWWARVLGPATVAPLATIGRAMLDARLSGDARAPLVATMLWGAWIAGGAVTTLRLALGWWTLHRMTRVARPAGREWERLLRDCCSAMGADQRVELRLSSRVSMPMTWGALDPVILLPDAADAWPAERRRMVLLHEVAHVQRHDCLAQAVVALGLAWYWFHPLAWWAERGLRAAREEACDERVVAAGVRRSAYAECLLALASGGSSQAMGEGAAALAMARRSGLGRRVRLVLARRRAAHRTPAWMPRVATAVAVAWALLLGSVRLSPRRDVMWSALADDDWRTRAWAAAVLSRSRSPEVRAELRARASHDAVAAVRRFAGLATP